MIKYSLIHNRKGILGKNGKALIQIRAYDSNFRKCKYLSTGISIEPKKWDKARQKINHYHHQYISLNRILENKVVELHDYEISLVEKGKECTLDMLEQFNLNGKTRMSFNEFVDYELKNCSLRKTTIIQQTVFLHKINEFNPNLTFTQIDYDLCCKFQKFLTDKGLNPNSIAKEFKNFKKFVNLAISKEYIDIRRNPFPKFKVKTIPSKKIFLTDEEIVRIEKLDLSEDNELDMVRNMYLFGAYTGLRFSDIVALKKEDIIKKSDGSWNLDIRMLKTENLLLLPLHKLFKGKPKELLVKYSKLNGVNPKYFKNYSNQHVNRLLKIIAKFACISKKLTFHSSRHSFATSLLNSGVRIETVQGLMGHQKLQQTQDYAKLLNTSVNKELDLIWQ